MTDQNKTHGVLTNRPTLERCPFCGGAAHYSANTFYGDDSMARCATCGATAFWSKWNERIEAAPQSPVAPADELVSMVYRLRSAAITGAQAGASQEAFEVAVKAEDDLIRAIRARPAEAPTTIDPAFLVDLERSRAKYPNNASMFDGLLGEIDELRRAYGGDGDVRAEAFDVAVCAYRIATEGDAGGNTLLAPTASATGGIRGPLTDAQRIHAGSLASNLLGLCTWDARNTVIDHIAATAYCNGVQDAKKLNAAPTPPTSAADAAIEQRDIAIQMLAEWCADIDRNGSGWDAWDENYKNASSRPGPLRDLLDAAIAASKGNGDE